MTRLSPRSALLVLAGLALVVRAGFVAFSPGVLVGDALWHHTRAVAVAHGAGYVNMNGSPSIAWMPGWSLLLAGLYALLGPSVRLGFAANVVLGAATAVMLARLGWRLFSPRVGIVAGLIFALWPGNVYYTATLMSETFFDFALVACLLLLVTGLSPDVRRRGCWLAAAGAAFGAAAMIKAEPLVLLPVLLAALATGLRGARSRARSMALFLLATALVIAPWVVRNYVHFGRVIVTSGTGPANAWLGNHEGASGGQAMQTAIRQSRYLREHPEKSGYRLAWEFAVGHPREEARILWKKLVLTYGRDDDAVTLIRGVRGRRLLHPLVERRLRVLANVWWAAVVALACVGVSGVRGWSALARLVALGVPASWLLVHLVFIGGARFHVPETPSIALCAAAGCLRLLPGGAGPKGPLEEG